MSKDTHENENPEQELTPLEAVKEQQRVMQENKEVTEQRVESLDEIPGHSVPSDIRHHPQRTQY